jgi:hypothetical protein
MATGDPGVHCAKNSRMMAVDACLADDRFFEPYRQRFHT